MNRMAARSLGHYSFLVPRIDNTLPRRVLPQRRLHRHHSLRKSEGKLGSPTKVCETEITLLLEMILTSPHPTTFDKIEWGNGLFAVTQEHGDTSKQRHLNRRGEIESNKNGRGTQKMPSLSEHALRKQTARFDTIEVSNGRFRRCQDPLTHPSSISLFREGGGQDVNETLGKDGGKASLCPWGAAAPIRKTIGLD